MLLGAGTCFIAPGRQAWGLDSSAVNKVCCCRSCGSLAIEAWGSSPGGSTAPPPGTLEPIKLVNSVGTEALEGR